MLKVDFIVEKLGLNNKQIEQTLQLFEEGATVPFIARYRKEMTQGLDEVQITGIRDESTKYDEITARQSTILKRIKELGKLNDELKLKVESTFDLGSLEDIYLPFKQKRVTLAEKARKNGLEPLAKIIMSQNANNPEGIAQKYVKGEIDCIDAALTGAKQIIAEWVNENIGLRNTLRKMYASKGVLVSKVVKTKMEEAAKYKDYFTFEESLKRCASHRFMAITRGQNEGFLRVKLQIDKEDVQHLLRRFFVKGNNASSDLVLEAAEDAYSRLLAPSIENEFLARKKEEADEGAIKVFTKNLRQLLLAPPLGEKRILAIDPGFRTGCKVVCLDENGKLLTNTTIYPHPPQKDQAKAKSKIAQLVQAYKIEAIAIGDGTAGRETEHLVKRIHFDRDVQVFSVNEDGASIYSASSIARKEFPEYDVTVRGAVSIGRRLMDPLSELVKIDPKSLGVGQYQHDVNQNKLKLALDDVVVSCVNSVGIDLNTASPYLLQHVSGLGLGLAENIVAYRNQEGRFENRKDLLKVKRLGAKAYEQAAGFLRIREGENPLDNTALHPEQYALVEEIAKRKKMKVADVLGDKEMLSKLNHEDFNYVGAYTFNDVIQELQKPGRDPRNKVKVLEFDQSINSIADLSVGRKLRGIVTNVTNFGAFVNIGIKENGLIHKSQLADTFVEDPSDYIRLNEHVNVEVVSLDVERKRIGLKRL